MGSQWSHPTITALPLPTLAQPRVGLWRTFWSCVAAFAGRLATW